MCAWSKPNFRSILIGQSVIDADFPIEFIRPFDPDLRFVRRVRVWGLDDLFDGSGQRGTGVLRVYLLAHGANAKLINKLVKGQIRPKALEDLCSISNIRTNSERRKQMEEELVFHTSNGRRRNDSNLLDRYLKPAGTKLGMPWLKWHTLRDAQEQVGHSKMSTILEIYSRRSAEQRRITIEKLSVLTANDGKFA